MYICRYQVAHVFILPFFLKRVQCNLLVFCCLFILQFLFFPFFFPYFAFICFAYFGTYISFQFLVFYYYFFIRFYSCLLLLTCTFVFRNSHYHKHLHFHYSISFLMSRPLSCTMNESSIRYMLQRNVKCRTIKHQHQSTQRNATGQNITFIRVHCYTRKLYNILMYLKYKQYYKNIMKFTLF